MPFLPIDAAQACIRRSQRFLALASENLPDSKIRNDLRRSALITSVAAIDTYMHWMILRRLSSVRRQGDLPKALARYDMEFSEIANLADAIIAAQRLRKGLRPWVQVKDSLQKRLLQQTFQSYEQVGTAFALAGIDKGWSRIADILAVKAEDIKSKLNQLVYRRNQIVHEGDITRASRPRKLQYNEVDHDKVVADVDWIEKLVNAIEAVVAEG